MSGLIVVGIPPQISLTVAVFLSTCVHFILNRQWVFSGESTFSRHISSQGWRYLTMVAGSYIATSLAIGFLPGLLGLPVLAVYFATNILLAAVSFPLLRWWVFRRDIHRAGSVSHAPK